MEQKCTIGWALWKRLKMTAEGSDYSGDVKKLPTPCCLPLAVLEQPLRHQLQALRHFRLRER
jgi:hypothetical protein